MKRHEFNPLYLVIGSVFAIVGSLFTFTDARASDIEWSRAWPLVLIAIGVLVFAGGISRVARRSERPLPDDGSQEDELEVGQDDLD